MHAQEEYANAIDAPHVTNQAADGLLSKQEGSLVSSAARVMADCVIEVSFRGKTASGYMRVFTRPRDHPVYRRALERPFELDI